MKRRHFLSVLAATPFVACAPNVITKTKPRFAITMDDFGLDFDKVLPPVVRNERILETFAKHNHKAAGFVTGRNVHTELGEKVVQSWSDAGHLIGNHTYSHMNSTNTEAKIVKEDILRNDGFLSEYTGYKKIFRFPFLAEGGTPEKVALYRDFLKREGFQNAAVTIDSIDWYTTSRLEKRLAENEQADTTAYRDYYVKAVLEMSRHFQNLAEAVGYTSLPHSMLMHHNVLNGLYLDDVLKALKAEGWDLMDAADVFEHPFYKLEPETPNRGRSQLSVLALEKGLDTSGFPQAYRGFGEKTMDALGL